MDSESTAEGSSELENPLLLSEDADDYWAAGSDAGRGGQCCVKRRRKRWICCATVGLVLALFAGFGMPLIVDNFVYKGIHGDVVIDSPDADGFEQFKDKSLTGDTTISFYLFNVTNPKQVLRGHKPKLEEIGPFVYTSYQFRSGFEWDKDKDTLAYREHSYYVFNRSLTATQTAGKFVSDDVRVITLNLLFQGMRAKVGTLYWKEICDRLLWKTDMNRLFTERTVREILNGYEEHIDLFGVKIPLKFPGIYPNLTRWNDPAFRKKSVMRVGKKDINKVYELVKVEGSSHVKVECPYGGNPLPGGQYCPHKYPCCQEHGFLPHSNRVPIWQPEKISGVWDKDANLVHGTNGEQFRPGLNEDSHLFIFNTIIQRTLKFVSRKRVDYKGIHMIRFHPDKTHFYNASRWPSNYRYYLWGPEGLFGNLSMVEQGCDVYASLPHFLYGADELVHGVEGLAPNEEKHSMHIDVEPILGQTMIEHVRAQINGRVGPVHLGFETWFRHVKKNMYIPIGWFDDASVVTQQGVDEFMDLYTARNLKLGSMISAVALGVIVLGVVIQLYFMKIPAATKKTKISKMPYTKGA